MVAGLDPAKQSHAKCKPRGEIASPAFSGKAMTEETDVQDPRHRVIPLECNLPPGKGYGSARGLTKRRGGGLVLLDTEDGVQGVGEAWGPPSVTRACLGVGEATLCRPQRVGAARRGADRAGAHVSLRHAEPIDRAGWAVSTSPRTTRWASC